MSTACPAGVHQDGHVGSKGLPNRWNPHGMPVVAIGSDALRNPPVKSTLKRTELRRPRKALEAPKDKPQHRRKGVGTRCVTQFKEGGRAACMVWGKVYVIRSSGCAHHYQWGVKNTEVGHTQLGASVHGLHLQGRTCIHRSVDLIPGLERCGGIEAASGAFDPSAKARGRRDIKGSRVLHPRLHSMRRHPLSVGIRRERGTFYPEATLQKLTPTLDYATNACWKIGVILVQMPARQGERDPPPVQGRRQESLKRCGHGSAQRPRRKIAARLDIGLARSADPG
ncbi:hypothetical protein C8Q80DRAFT_1124126 [Daedaleopsis nitida]|nr:hypothetical protein C8Q80DRAFT_1124126 [Daedaleopsis nitida]